MIDPLTLGTTLAGFTWMVGLSCTLSGSFIALKKFRKTPPHLDAPFSLYPVSIIKPLKGGDPGLRENLESFFKLSYPSFEILFCIPNASDPALPLVKKLIEEYPKAPARLLVGETFIGPNPKINNIWRAYETARYDYVLISDSNVRVEPDYLKRLVAHLGPSVGMVTAVVAGQSPSGMGGQLEATYLNTFYARWMCFAEKLGRPCVVGKSMLFSRKTAKRFGGLKVLSQFLAEDYMAGEAMRRLGLEVVIVCDPVRQIIGNHTFKAFWSRHLRWGRIRKSQEPLAFAIEPFFSPLTTALLGAWCFHTHFGTSLALFVALHLTAWSICDFLMMRKLQNEARIYMPAYWFFREILAFPLWLHVASGNSIQWRGQNYTLKSGGTLARA